MKYDSASYIAILHWQEVLYITIFKGLQMDIVMGNSICTLVKAYYIEVVLKFLAL